MGAKGKKIGGVEGSLIPAPPTRILARERGGGKDGGGRG